GRLDARVTRSSVATRGRHGRQPWPDRNPTGTSNAVSASGSWTALVGADAERQGGRTWRRLVQRLRRPTCVRNGVRLATCGPASLLLWRDRSNFANAPPPGALVFGRPGCPYPVFLRPSKKRGDGAPGGARELRYVSHLQAG